VAHKAEEHNCSPPQLNFQHRVLKVVLDIIPP
jgi:hypothetical protein